MTPWKRDPKTLPQPTRPIPKTWDINRLRDKLKELKRKKVSPQRPGGKGPKTDKRWDKGDKHMTPLKSGGRVLKGKKVGCQIK